MALFFLKSVRKKHRLVHWEPVYTCRSVKYCKSPPQFCVSSALNSFYGLGSCLINSWRYLAYWRFMKFFIASKSTNATDSALFNFKCMKKWMVINFLLNINTSKVCLHLISANLIKLCENPKGPPSYWSTFHYPRGRGSQYEHVLVRCIGLWSSVAAAWQATLS